MLLKILCILGIIVIICWIIFAILIAFNFIRVAIKFKTENKILNKEIKDSQKKFNESYQAIIRARERIKHQN